MGSEGGGMRGVALAVALVLGASAGAWAVPVSRLEQQARALTIDGGFDEGDAERLIVLALSDDLRFSREEAGFIAAQVRRHGLDAVEVPGADGAEGLVDGRARRLMIQALRSGTGATAYRRAMQQLVGLAMDPELTREERFRVLELVDRYRRVDVAVSTRDSLEAIALLLSNPTEARLDREHRRKLELLEKQFQVPVILDAASGSVFNRPTTSQP